MKCIYCGEELKDGSLFCSKCGKEVQMVPDYNLFDDDYLKQVLAEENASAGNENPNPNTVRKQPGNPKEQKKILDANPKIKDEWDEKVGDRMIKLCVIGQNLDKEAISAELDKCLED